MLIIEKIIVIFHIKNVIFNVNIILFEGENINGIKFNKLIINTIIIIELNIIIVDLFIPILLLTLVIIELN